MPIASPCGGGVEAAVSDALAETLDNRAVVELSLTLALYVGLAHLTGALDVPDGLTRCTCFSLGQTVRERAHWLSGVRLQDIRLFVAAYEEKSFTAAATRENSTQSGVSHHIRQLETLLNVKLFVREKGRRHGNTGGGAALPSLHRFAALTRAGVERRGPFFVGASRAALRSALSPH